MIESSYNESDPPIYRVVIISIQKGTHSFEYLFAYKKDLILRSSFIYIRIYIFLSARYLLHIVQLYDLMRRIHS